ncbi:uncharacterized protein AMSG_06123 [Thecamonas trahens ATCC 50062]|uniref:Uncharacterized protein n=1 Tax=Thecamonas trahens ATCC 50062 TaxID=461836 RepID=A0A0L0DBW0_THETB|nr:hypothetical protein AMSG_06123 [Thecamonas trahens ATCC 50062]KNC49839.1 hypothetical protein AMSG_06123 [Thecamonas trahens ATCC 50062]|eukprot:XP_013757330.1 hypothetical protein AMSG_06123 [Thecamonas trahens ATCC 50062]
MGDARAQVVADELEALLAEDAKHGLRAAEAASGGAGGRGGGFRAGGGEEVRIDMDAVADEAAGLSRASSRLDEMIEMGWASVDQLREDGSMLKRAKTKLLDLSASLGFSLDVIRMVERRDGQDRWILYAGMLLVVVVLLVSVFYIRPWWRGEGAWAPAPPPM